MFWTQCEICERQALTQSIRVVRGKKTCGRRACRREAEKSAPSDTSKKRLSQKHEKELAEASGGRVVPGSGALPGMDGDVEWPNDWLVEAKATTKNQLAVKKAVWEKIAGEAAMRLKKPALALRINGEHVVAISLDDFLELTTSETE